LLEEESRRANLLAALDAEAQDEEEQRCIIRS